MYYYHYLLNADMYMSEKAKFVDAHAMSKKPKSYSQWVNLVTMFSSKSAKAWHEPPGDFWGGVMCKYTRQGRSPLIVELFQPDQEHRPSNP
jgi:hypothetical protein